MKYLTSIHIIEAYEYNGRGATSTYFGHSLDFWDEFAGKMNECGNFEFEFGVEDYEIVCYRAGIYVTAKERDQCMMDLSLD